LSENSNDNGNTFFHSFVIAYGIQLCVNDTLLYGIHKGKLPLKPLTLIIHSNNHFNVFSSLTETQSMRIHLVEMETSKHRLKIYIFSRNSNSIQLFYLLNSFNHFYRSAFIISLTISNPRSFRFVLCTACNREKVDE
jgi:hypothetical protein